MFIAAVYALLEQYELISSHMTKLLDGIFIVAGDLNQTVLKMFHKHVYTPTRGRNALDYVDTNFSGRYKALPHPEFGLSDHICQLFLPSQS